MDANDEIFQKILGDDAFKELLLEWYARQVFNKANRVKEAGSYALMTSKCSVVARISRLFCPNPIFYDSNSKFSLGTDTAGSA
jgi:hypothetical protein